MNLKLTKTTSMEDLLNNNSPTEDSICDIIYEVIKTRNLQGLSQKDLATKANVSIACVKNLEEFLIEKISLVDFSNVLEVLGIKLKVDNG